MVVPGAAELAQLRGSAAGQSAGRSGRGRRDHRRRWGRRLRRWAAGDRIGVGGAMSWEESRERLTLKRWQERTRRQGILREEGAGVREGLKADLRANGRFDDQSGAPLAGLMTTESTVGG